MRQCSRNDWDTQTHEDPRNTHTILIGGFEEQKYKSKTKRVYEHYIKTNLVGNLFSK